MAHPVIRSMLTKPTFHVTCSFLKNRLNARLFSFSRAPVPNTFPVCSRLYPTTYRCFSAEAPSGGGDEGGAGQGLANKGPAWEAASPKVRLVVEKVLDLNVIEIIMLVQYLEFRTGVPWGPGFGRGMGGGAAATGAGAGDAAPAEEKKEKEVWDLKVTGFEASAKIKLIKEVRTITGVGLKEAKEMVDNLPKVVQKGMKKEEAEQLMQKLKDLGAEAELE
uniref:Large ribosomal subunit protein bL12 C-terminal domain-containing protein n=1 Tax=Fibrocapsa japonica TaxID=94617 RepID=A0A7S2XYV8_9STRA|mmetsp:Transcript_4172/g.6231  ORF Transcript_4172/g.6231 Transcript_4172/m.6231 type:complete len:220 (+) Transcript_4172:163-822(+)|eukprot:CAMPEP_0113936120 /NCGR_PEP_ID=MMETSP1339-20121228/3093_1 /TAXON_ID=94617 /ORGANISM="Fibrocapsa japonica" /LENGTH=219 /DNA_ID=CAMNT_0000938467 /DNA_START=147 /DNA_END=806 /DNA_ORIENTATION=+ /assembly_acc=CAM_ASM_000762